MTVSELDRQYHAAFIDPKNIRGAQLPDENDYTLREERTWRRLAMTANFSMFMNFEGLKWLVDQVWNDELAEKFELLLVGRHSKKLCSS